MSNMVPCKLCSTEFDYSPGFAGNARQLCGLCKTVVGDEELKKLEEQTITEDNKYLRGDTYDPVDILLDGSIPTLERDADRFICAVELGKFVRNNGVTGIRDNIIKLFDALGSVHSLLFCQQLTTEQLEALKWNFPPWSDKIK